MGSKKGLGGDHAFASRPRVVGNVGLDVLGPRHGGEAIKTGSGAVREPGRWAARPGASNAPPRPGPTCHLAGQYSVRALNPF
jgi:hypothetical protein